MPDNAPSLLILSGVQGDPRRYRTFHLYEQASLAGLKCELSHLTDPGLRKKAIYSDIIILHRAAFDSQVEWLERTIHQKGGLLVFDLDDLVIDPTVVKFIHSPDFSDPVRRSLYLEDIQRFRKTLDLCDAALTSCMFLANYIRQLGKPAYVHRNAFSLEMRSLSERAFRSRQPDSTRIVIGYASGTPTHDRDFELIAPALQIVMSRYPNVELWLVGPLDPGGDWGNLSPRIKQFDLVPWRNLPEMQVMFDINIAPVEINNPFGRSKSEIKYMEAALLRVPTIASPSESYSTAIRQGENGFLAMDIADWEQFFEVLIQSPEHRLSMGDKAYRDVLQHYQPWVRAEQLVNTLNEIAGQKYELHSIHQKVKLSPDKPPTPFWSSLEQESYPSNFQRGLYSLRHRSVGTLLKQIWIFLRRSVSPIFPYRYPPERTDHDAVPW